MGIYVKIDMKGLEGWRRYVNDSMLRAARMAGGDALRKMRTEASRGIRSLRALKAARVNKALTLYFPTGKESLIWRIKASGAGMPVAAFAHSQNNRGVRALIKAGVPSLIPHAFVATMKSGHTGVFMRYGGKRISPIQGYKGHRRNAGRKAQPIRELFTTNVANAFSDNAQAIARAGEDQFMKTFRRIMAASGKGTK